MTSENDTCPEAPERICLIRSESGAWVEAWPQSGDKPSIEYVRADLAPAPRPAAGEGEGWQWVPKEPTDEMNKAGHATLPFDTCEADAEDVYVTMLAAAPKPPQSPSGAEGWNEALSAAAKRVEEIARDYNMPAGLMTRNILALRRSEPQSPSLARNVGGIADNLWHIYWLLGIEPGWRYDLEEPPAPEETVQKLITWARKQKDNQSLALVEDGPRNLRHQIAREGWGMSEERWRGRGVQGRMGERPRRPDRSERIEP